MSVIAGAAGALVALGAWLQYRHGGRHASLLLIGAALGLVLHHAAFGFTRAYRRLVTAGDGAGVRAQLLMLALATVLFAPALAAGQVFGQPVAGAVAPAGVSVLVGAFMFGAGMQLGGGCGSGTLYQVGAGRAPLAVTLVFFVAGGVLATFHLPFWTALPSLGAVALGERLGWVEAVIIQVGACGLLALGSRWLEGPRRPVRPGDKTARGGRGLVQGPWSLATGAVLLALLNLLTLVVAGHPWTITWAFTLWGGKALEVAGYDLSHVAFWSGAFQRSALGGPLLADVTSVMDIGLVLGALLGAGLAGSFGPVRRVPASRLAASIAGGLMLGYGARIAFGCNVGALFSGVASTSLHGWLWGAAALAGTPLGLWLRRFLRVDG